MTIRLSMPQSTELKPRIVVFGVGGAGGNAVDNMISADLQGCDFVVANTDAQALARSKAERRIQLGANTTQGLGAGANPDVGMAAAEETVNEILDQLDTAHMVFITAGMGGGTGTGAAPVIARAAKERGILTVAVVTKPFDFEGGRRSKMAEAGLAELQKYVDTLIVIPNQNLFRVANEKTTFADAFHLADQVLHSGVRGITDLMVRPGLINLDFADVRSVMSEMGKAMMGTGEASGDRRAAEAAIAAINNPLLEDVSLKGARGVLINITGGYDMTLYELDEAANHIRSEVDADANIIVGSTLDQSMEGKLRVSVVATGIDAEIIQQARPVATQTAHANAAPRPMHGQPVAAQQPTPIGRPVVRVGAARDVAPSAASVQATPIVQTLPPVPEPLTSYREPEPEVRREAAPEPRTVQPAAEAPRNQDRRNFERPHYERSPVTERFGPMPRLEPRPEPQREKVGGFSLFGRPKRPEAPVRQEPAARAPQQQAPLFADEFDDTLEIPAFLRRQAN